ncbi:hypothetical protein EVAR_87036_1 [Eumeta japonica]|uniref:Uncharacterized protein n=1 Tax=Eumeta variegata TaxID=151549 RepID=A0A4C1Z4R1_EUMVA|nr:hypothetical protein EVAR_87036_1 [Eumeta japonica]
MRMRPSTSHYKDRPRIYVGRRCRHVYPAWSLEHTVPMRGQRVDCYTTEEADNRAFRYSRNRPTHSTDRGRGAAVGRTYTDGHTRTQQPAPAPALSEIIFQRPQRPRPHGAQSDRPTRSNPTPALATAIYLKIYSGRFSSDFDDPVTEVHLSRRPGSFYPRLAFRRPLRPRGRPTSLTLLYLIPNAHVAGTLYGRVAVRVHMLKRLRRHGCHFDICHFDGHQRAAILRHGGGAARV